MKLIVTVAALFMFTFFNLYSVDYDWIRAGNYTASMWHAKVSEGGKYYAYTSNWMFHIIDIESGNLVKEYGLGAAIKPLFINDDSEVQTYAESTIRHIDLSNDNATDITPDNYKEFRIYSQSYQAMSAKLNLFVSYGDMYNSNDFKIYIIDMENWDLIDSININFSSDKGGLAIIEDKEILVYSDGNSIVKYDLKAHNILQSINTANYNGNHLISSKDGSIIAYQTLKTGEQNKSNIEILETENLDKIGEYECSLNDCQASISPDNQYIAIVNNQNNINIIDIEKKEVNKTINTILVPNLLFFCTDGEELIASEHSTALSIKYDIGTGQQVNTLVVSESPNLFMKLSNDDKYIFSTGLDNYSRHLLKIIDATNGNLLNLLELGHYNGNTESFCGDYCNNSFIACCKTKEIMHLNLNDMAVEYFEVPDHIRYIACSDNGNEFVSGSTNGTIRTHDISTGEILKEKTIDSKYTIFNLSYAEDEQTIYFLALDESTHESLLYSWDTKKDKLLILNDYFPATYDYNWAFMSFINANYLAYNLYLWDIEQSEFYDLSYVPYYKTIGDIDITQDGKYIAYTYSITVQGSEKRLFNLYDFKGKNLIKQYLMDDYYQWKYFNEANGNGIPQKVEFTSDEKMIVSLDDGTLLKLAIIDTTQTSVNNTSIDNHNLQIYPNPIKENSVISLELPEASNVNIRIFDISGNVIAEKEYDCTGGKNIIPVGSLTKGLASGVYIINAKGDKVSFVEMMRVVE